jgi:hypothetical protein
VRGVREGVELSVKEARARGGGWARFASVSEHVIRSEASDGVSGCGGVGCVAQGARQREQIVTWARSVDVCCGCGNSYTRGRAGGGRLSKTVHRHGLPPPPRPGRPRSR